MTGDNGPSPQRIRLREALRRIDDEAPEQGSRRYAELASDAFAAADEVLVVEGEQLRSEQERQRQGGARTIRRVAGITGTVLVVFALIAALPGWITAWWLVLLIPLALVASGMWLFENECPLEGQRDRRIGAVVLAISAAAMITVLATPIPQGWAVVAAWAAAASLLYYASPATPITSDEPSEGHP